MRKLKQFIRDLCVRIFRVFGSDIKDFRTGKTIGRGLILPWNGRIHMLGFEHAIVPLPINQKRVTYWKQEIGFTFHSAVDFPNRREAQGSQRPDLDKVLLVMLDHRSQEQVEENLKLWGFAGFIPEQILLVYGGPREEFSKIGHPNTIFLEGDRLRTKDHQRERQSYRELQSKTSEWIQGSPFSHILFHEFDHFPLVSDLKERLLERLSMENADVLGYHLGRIDGTTHPHWLNCAEETYDSEIVLSMLGTGHFWKREAWEGVADDRSLMAWYLELDIPTTAHRLGFRVRSLKDQEPYVQALADSLPNFEAAIRSGAWTLHPVKNFEFADRIGAHLKSIVNGQKV